MFDTIRVSITDIVGMSQKPISLLRYDHSTRTLLRVHEEVRAHVTVCMDTCNSSCMVQDCSAYLEPHPMREKATGKPVVVAISVIQ